MAKAYRKAKARLDKRIEGYENPPKGTVRRHQHHKPGSMNRKKG